MSLRVALLEIDHWHVPMYVDALRPLDAEIVGVSDADLPRAQELARSLGCRAFATAADLLDRETVDLALAFAPHWRMLDLARLLVERSQPFAMEKPMALQADALAELLPSAEATGLFAGVAFVRRLGGFPRALLDRREELGEIHQFQHRFVGGPIRRYVEWNCPWMLDREKAGGGCMINFGTHAIDLFLSLVREPVCRVFCQTSHRLSGATVEDLSSSLLETVSGAQAVLESAYLLPAEPKEDLMSLSTAAAFASNNLARWQRPTICFRDGERVEVTEPEPDYSAYVSDVVRRFRAGEAPVATIRDMVRVLSIVEAAYASAASGKPVAPSPIGW